MDAPQLSPEQAALADRRASRFALYAVGAAVLALLLAAAYAYWFPPARGGMRHYPAAPVARPLPFAHDARFGSRESGYRLGEAAFGPAELAPGHAAPPPPLAPEQRAAVRDAMLTAPYQQPRHAVQRQRYFGRTESARPESTFIDAHGSGSDYAHSAHGAAAAAGADSLPNLHYQRHPPRVDMSLY